MARAFNLLVLFLCFVGAVCDSEYVVVDIDDNGDVSERIGMICSICFYVPFCLKTFHLSKQVVESIVSTDEPTSKQSAASSQTDIVSSKATSTTTEAGEDNLLELIDRELNEVCFSNCAASFMFLLQT
jgi:hypothetical protein